jgi:hypothetical protein
VEKMLKSAGYTDMGVIDELRNGTALVGCVERTEFWPTKFQPASVTLEKSHDMASKERGGLHQQFVGVCEGDFIEQVWNKTMEENYGRSNTGVLVGLIPLNFRTGGSTFSKAKESGA